jgi:Zn-dependent protease
MLRLLSVPIELFRIAFYALQGLIDALRARNRPRFEFTVLINAPPEAVWRFNTADHMVLDGPPVMEISQKPIPDSADLWLTRVTVNGQPRAQGVTRVIERDEANGIIRAQSVAHPLSIPPEGGRDVQSGLLVKSAPEGTALTMVYELTVRAFRDRIVYPAGLRGMALRIKQQCEKEAGTDSRLAVLANHGLLLSATALLSFCYLLGWKLGLLLAAVVILHEAGHVAAMLAVGVGVRGIYLIPFFGGAAVPKTAYRTESRLGFVALMGPGLSLIPTLGLIAIYRATGEVALRQAAEMFAVVNAANLLPIYPLDGGLILNALVGSISRKFALILAWIGLLAGIGVAVYLQSFLIGIPFLLFALQRYLTNSKTIELQRLSLASGIALALASIMAFVAYGAVIKAIWMNPPRRHLTFQASPVQNPVLVGITPPSTSVNSAAIARTMQPNTGNRSSVILLAMPETEIAAKGSLQSL